MASLAQTMRDRRERSGLSLSELARRVGVSKAYLSMIENERVGNPPSPDLIDRLERELGVRDAALARAAEWARTPPGMRARLAELDARARRADRRSREFVNWLRASTTAACGGGKNLDRLFRTGQLGRRVDELLGEADGSTGAEGTEGEFRDGEPAGGFSGGFSGGGSGGGSRGGSGDLATGGLMAAPPPHRIPLINRVAAGYPTGFTDLDYPARVADDYVSAPVDDPDAFAATVVGESMEPDYRAGDIVVFSPQADVSDGADCFARIEPDHETTFKRVYFEDGGDSIRLQPLNPAFAARTLPRDRVAGLYRAVWRLSRLV